MDTRELAVAIVSACLLAREADPETDEALRRWQVLDDLLDEAEGADPDGVDGVMHELAGFAGIGIEMLAEGRGDVTPVEFWREIARRDCARRGAPAEDVEPFGGDPVAHSVGAPRTAGTGVAGGGGHRGRAPT